MTYSAVDRKASETMQFSKGINNFFADQHHRLSAVGLDYPQAMNRLSEFGLAAACWQKQEIVRSVNGSQSEWVRWTSIQKPIIALVSDLPLKQEVITSRVSRRNWRLQVTEAIEERQTVYSQFDLINEQSTARWVAGPITIGEGDVLVQRFVPRIFNHQRFSPAYWSDDDSELIRRIRLWETACLNDLGLYPQDATLGEKVVTLQEGCFQLEVAYNGGRQYTPCGQTFTVLQSELDRLEYVPASQIGQAASGRLSPTTTLSPG